MEEKVDAIQKRESDKLAIISLITGILAILTFNSCGIFLGIISIVLAAKALKDSCCAKRPMAITGIITSVIGFILALILIMIEMQPINMPDVTGKSYSDAKTEIKNISAELTIESIEEYNDIIEEDFVIKTEPAAGEVIDEKEPIIMYVSKGRQFLMPEIVGLKIEEAEKVLTEMGMELEIIDEEYSEAEIGTIVECEYEAGYDLKYGGRRIPVKISKGTLEAEIAELVANAEGVTHEDLLRYPESYQTKPIKLTINVSKVEDQTFLGFTYGTAIWATLDDKTIILSDDREVKEPTILEGDTITIYGYGNGLTSLDQTQKDYWGGLLFGFTYDKTVDTIDVPHISIRHIEF